MVKKSTLKTLDQVAMTLTFVGGINWGLIGVFDYNLVQAVAGGLGEMAVDGVYTAVGISAGWLGWKQFN